MNEKVEQSVQLRINRLKSLPVLPEASVKILEAINDPDISIEKLAEILSLSPGLVARLLGLANSAYFGRSRQINDLRTAIVQVLGLQLVKSLTVGIVLNVQFDIHRCKHFNTQSFWMHSLMTAVAAQKLSLLCGWTALPVSTIYTCGLLLDIGVLVIAYLFPEELDVILVSEQSRYFQVRQEISRELGQSHYHIGYVLLKKWQLPDVYQAILQHFDDLELSRMEAELIGFLKASQQICCLILDQGDQEGDPLVRIAEQAGLPIEHVSGVFYDLVENKENLQQLAEAMGR